MDAYEDCDAKSAEPSLYRREEVDVVTCKGETLRAQAYLFNRPLPHGSRLIAQGDFRAWLGAEGLPAFRGTRAD